MAARRAVAGLWLAVVLSALAVVNVSHQCRQLYSELAVLQREQNSLQVAWGQYLLEQSSLSSLSRIETKAIAELEMRVPDISEVIMVAP